MPDIETLLRSKPIENPYERAMLGIMYTSHWLLTRMNLLLRPFGITEPQYNVLRILRGQHGKPITVADIQERMVQPSSNVSRIIDKLVEKGSVSRNTCEANKRRVDILITAAGLQLLKDIEPVLKDYQKAMSKAISDEDASCLSRFLDALRDMEAGQ